MLAWIAMVAVDFLLNGGILAPLYDWASTFLLAPATAFARIPIAYAGLAVQAGVLTVVLPRLGVRNGAAGVWAAMLVGGGLWTAFVLGLASISSADPATLAGWWIAEIVEVGVAGWLIGCQRAGASTRWLGIRVAGLSVACVLTAVVLQSVGYAAQPISGG